ncbi:MAG: biotin-dependent carboxyltransferase family protein [Alphaproteobacteria bacterium]
MTTCLRVLNGGIMATIQDRGRIGYQRYGVPVSGALDPVSFRLANAAAGNRQSAAAIEMIAAGAIFEVEGPSVRVALGGLGATLEVTDDGTTRSFPALRSVTARHGATIAVLRPPLVSCCYLAVEGEFDLAPVMGSQSTYLRGHFGGFHGRALRPGDRLPLVRRSAKERREFGLMAPPDPGHPDLGHPDLGHDEPIRVVLGPQADAMTQAALEVFLSQPFAVGRETDRMGMRLDGPRLSHRDGFNIPSDGVTTGSIQVPGDGRPIVLLVDRQTTGGYPKIATVASADIARIARRRPGDPVRFRAISVQEAEAARRDLERRIEDIAARREPIREDGAVDLAALYEENIVSGVHRDID